MVPDHGIDTVYNVNNKQPGDHGQRRDVPRAPVPWQGDEDEGGCDERDVGEFGGHCRARGGEAETGDSSEFIISLRTYAEYDDG